MSQEGVASGYEEGNKWWLSEGEEQLIRSQCRDSGNKGMADKLISMMNGERYQLHQLYKEDIMTGQLLLPLEFRYALYKLGTRDLGRL